MTIDDVIAACSTLDAAELTHPFGPDSSVFKVAGKMFAIVGDAPERLTVKCDPEHAALLIDQFDAITPGYHTNKRHWITIDPHGQVPDTLVEDLIGESYDLVVASLPARVRNAL